MHKLKMDKTIRKKSTKSPTSSKKLRPLKRKREIPKEEDEEFNEPDIDMKMEFSASGFSLVNVFVDEIETLESLEQHENASNVLVSNKDPLYSVNSECSKSAVKKRKGKTNKEITELFIALNIRNIRPSKCLSKLTVCSSNCYKKLSKEDIRRNFNLYWEGATFISRHKFINQMTEVIPTKFRFSKNAKYQRYKTKHYLHTKQGRQTVCRICFHRILCEHERLIDTILEDKFNQLNGDLPLLSWSPLSECKNNCHSKVTTIEQQRNLFSYNKLKAQKDKINFLKNLIVVLQPGIKQTSEADTNQKKIYFVTFSLNSKNGFRTVCQQCFRTVFNESEDMIKLVLCAKWREIEQADSAHMDKEAVDPAVKILSSTTVQEQHCPTVNELKPIEKHLKKFSLCESHHYPGQSSKQNPEKYLPIGLTLETLYELYKSSVSEPVSFNRYQFILKQTNFKFEPSLYGKCKICIQTMEQLRLPNVEEEKELQTFLANHLIDVQGAKESKSRDEKAADKSNNVLWVCSFGYQKSLPTPYLNEPDAYYKLPLWTYNFTIQRHNGNSILSKRPKFYMWHEAHGGKTANEMSSCLYSFLLGLNRNVRSVIFCSSSDCPESRSKTVSMMFSYFMATQRKLITIEHKFLPAGHFQDSGQNVDNWGNNVLQNFHGDIEEPKDWYDAFNNPTKAKGMYEVVNLAPNKFYNFESLWKDPGQRNEPLLNKDIKRLLYTKRGVVCYTNSWTADAPFGVLSFKGQSKVKNLRIAKLEKLEKVPLTEKKKQDLLELVPLMKSFLAKNFYLGLCKNINYEPETTIVKEEIDLENEPEEIEFEEDWEPPEKMQKKSSLETDSDQFELVYKDEIIE